MPTFQPREDPTYSARDIVRFWTRNLDMKEAEDVVLFFTYVSAIAVIRDPLSTILGKALAFAEGIAPPVWKPVFRVLRRVLKIVVRAGEINDVLAAVGRISPGLDKLKAQAIRRYENLG